MNYHEPVLVEQVIDRLKIAPGLVLCDGTVGSAGHALAFLKALRGEGVFLGLDRDPEMADRARKRLETAPERGQTKVIVETARYEQLPEVLEREGLAGADGVLLDLGLNSLQIEQADRGFSFQKEGPLDGRFNPQEPGTRSIAELVNEASESDLASWLREYGDERYARRIAARIVRDRARHPFRTTTQLAETVRACYPPNERYGRINAGTRTFQALRIVANNELEEVEQGVRACIESLAPGGTLCVISYHSGEDKIVKRLFDEVGTPRPDPSNPYSATTKEGLDYRVEKRGAEKAGEQEIARNPRARSARLRILRRRGDET